MEKISPTRRLRVNDDTFALPDMDGAVYFRNNAGSFRMEGRSIEQWVERLLPLLNGKYSLSELTDGLPDTHQHRVYEIAAVLYNNGFARDVNEDKPHHLSDRTADRYAAQIAFLDNVKGSGAYRFEGYRNARVLAVGPDRTLVSLAAAAFESGLSEITLHPTKVHETNQTRLQELISAVKEKDAERNLYFLESNAGEGGPAGGAEKVSWDRLTQSFDAVLFISETVDKTVIKQLEDIERACRNNQSIFLPAVIAGSEGFAGPQTNRETAVGSWGAMWRRIHSVSEHQETSMQGSTIASTVDAGEVFLPRDVSSVAVAVLVNVLVYELFKAITEVTDATEAQYRFYRLNLKSLEGDWHSYMPYPADEGNLQMTPIADVTAVFRKQPAGTDLAQLLDYFERLTEPVSGVFHVWDEGSLTQLPLSLCRVQSSVPLPAGPAVLLKEKACAGLTHEDARREAGLVGLEDYVSFVATKSDRNENFIGLGAGATVAEALWRALHKNLTHELSERTKRELARQTQPVITGVEVTAIEDEICNFYLQVLHTLQSEPKAGLGETLWGCPVVWLSLGEEAIGSVGPDITTAFRTGLEHVLLTSALTDGAEPYTRERVVEAPNWIGITGVKRSLTLPAADSEPTDARLRETIDTLLKHGLRLELFDAAVEPFLREVIAALYGVALHKEESQ